MAGRTILFLIRDLDVGGAQRQVVELALGLQRSGWNVSVATFYGGGALADPLDAAGIPHLSLGKRGRWDVVRFTARLVRLVRSQRPDVVHGCMDMSNVLLALLRPVLGGARMVWGVAASHSHVSSYPRIARLEFRLGVLLSRFADLIICNSESGRAQHAAQGYATGRMIVIPNGIDVEHFRPDAAARRHVRTEWGIDDDMKLIGLVGRLDAMKDHPTFLRAAAQVAALEPRTRFVCVGDGPPAYKGRLAGLATALNLGERLIWAGERTDMDRVYNALDLAVSASVSEGLPNVIAEAMATGVPCVVTDVGDSARVVGSLGWICKPQDSAELAASMLRALAALPCDAETLRQRICSLYSSQARTARTAPELARLIGNGASVSPAI